MFLLLGGINVLISEILKENDACDYKIKNEQFFETLALCGSTIEKKFCTFLDDAKYIDSLSSNATMVIATKALETKICSEKRGVIVVENPRLFFFQLHNHLALIKQYVRESFATQISENADISDLAYISKQNVIIEDNVLIEPFVTIYPNVIIKLNSIISSGARIGGEGFEYKRMVDGIMAVTHVGGVLIGENVEIQNNACVDKAVYPWDDTIIGDYVKIDNMVHVAHAVKISENTMLVAQSGIGGRTLVGRNSWIGFGSTVRNGITIGDNSRANMGAVVTKTIPDGGAVTGNFAIEHEKFIEQMKKNKGEK